MKSNKINKYPEINNNIIKSRKIHKIYDLDIEDIKNTEIFMPLNEEDFNEENNDNKTTNSFLTKRLKDLGFINGIHSNLFNENIYSS